MRKQFQNQVRDLTLELVMLGSMIEEAVHNSIKSVKNHNQQLAEQVINLDNRVDEYEQKIEQKSISLLALQQPVAHDLRQIDATLKIASDLERIGDLALNISYISKKLSVSYPGYSLPHRISRMADLLQYNLREVLSAFIEENQERAGEVAAQDQKIDQLDQQIVNEMTSNLTQKKAPVGVINYWLFISRYLERIGDHITNICEWIVYICCGKRVDY